MTSNSSLRIVVTRCRIVGTQALLIGGRFLTLGADRMLEQELGVAGVVYRIPSPVEGGQLTRKQADPLASRQALHVSDVLERTLSYPEHVSWAIGRAEPGTFRGGQVWEPTEAPPDLSECCSS